MDRQLKEQFIHSLYDKNMLEETINELMTVRGDDQITSANVLAWAKRVEAQRAQAPVMSTITETKEFDKIKVSRPAWASNLRTPAQYNTPSQLWQCTSTKAEYAEVRKEGQSMRWNKRPYKRTQAMILKQ